MRHLFLLSLFILALNSDTSAQATISGRVLSSRDSLPISFAQVSVPAVNLWATANEEGEFTIGNVQTGQIMLSIQYLGFEKKDFKLNISGNRSGLLFYLDEDNLTLNQVEITAKKSAEPASSWVIDRRALDHLQMISLNDAMSLLPGGKTNRSLHLASSQGQPLFVNGSSGENGNPDFGVGVEVDGIRLSNNAILGRQGVDTRNLSASNIESIEVITGIPSVEYGDLTNGLVKITTRKGKSPYMVEVSAKPHTKLFALSKGFGLGRNAGVLNANFERARSISNLASPHTSYERNSLSLSFENSYKIQGAGALRITALLSGNTGGYNNEADPDLFTGTYSRIKDDALRGNLTLRWLLNKPWITSLEATANANYNDQIQESRSNKSATASEAAIHVKEEGYHVGELYEENPNAAIILIPRGFWYQLRYDDSKLFNYSGRIKAGWARRFGPLNSKFLLGGEYSTAVNNGRGEYYEDYRYAPTWREYRFDQLPQVQNYAVYAEEVLDFPLGESFLEITAGLRSDITSVEGSGYGTLANLSPRSNVKLTLWEKRPGLISELSIRAGWGKTVKLPSLSTLNPQPSYMDLLTFAPGTTADGQTFYAYYTMPANIMYNPDLKWQRNVQQEIGLNVNVAGTRITVIASQDKTSDPYTSQAYHNAFYYKFTDQSHLEGSMIPEADRVYLVDRNTGVVTVSDKTGSRPSETLGYHQRLLTIKSDMPVNGSDIKRRSLSWVVDFKEIRALRTSLKIDGRYYYYKGIEETLVASRPAAATMADGSHYRYVGYYIGGAQSANGSVTKSLNMNFTVKTHIPAMRMIFSARLEGSFYNFARDLSEYANGSRGFVLDSKDDYVPSTSENDIYGGDRFVGLYPEHYVNIEDMNTRIPFAEKFAWAKENDPALYNDLSKLVVKSNRDYTFNRMSTSAYVSANIGITKEIGRLASLSFNATNFFNNTATVMQRQTDTETSLFDSSRIPAFYYSMSLRIKW